MQGRRIDLCDPSSEGPAIAKRLAEEGWEVRVTPLVDVPLTRADALVMAGDLPSSLDALKLLRDEGFYGDVPVILLGLPAGASRPGGRGGFGADVVLPRPVDPADVVSALTDEFDLGLPERSRVEVARPERTIELEEERSPRDSGVHDVISGPSLAQPREPTMQLDGPSAPHDPFQEHSQVQDRDDDASLDEPVDTGFTRGVTGEREISCSGISNHEDIERSGVGSRPGTGHSGVGSRPGTGRSGSGVGSRPGTDAPERVIPVEQRARLSPWLEELLAAADRRVFPGRPPLQLHLPADDEPPERLVPAELLEELPLAFDEPALDDPIDAFTFVGGPLIPAGAALERSMTPATPAAESSPGTGRETSPETPLRRGRTERPQTETPPETPPEPPGTADEEERSEGSGVHRAPLRPGSEVSLGAAWPDDDPVLGSPAPDGTRRSNLGPGGALRLLWRLAALGLDAQVEITPKASRDAPEADVAVRATFIAGELRAFDGDALRRALAHLRARGRATEEPADEAAAEAILERRVATGALGRYERDRLVREAREAKLISLVACRQAEVVLRRLDDTEPGRALTRARVLGAPLRAALVEAAKRAFTVDEVRALLGDGDVGLVLGPDREAALAPAELPTELVQLVCRLEGHSLNALLDAAPDEPGLAGALYALVAGDALRLVERAAEEARPSESARAAGKVAIEAAAALAEDADYFRILGLAPSASGSEIADAHRRRSKELQALTSVSAGDDALEGERVRALEALDDALEALRIERLRVAYAAALDR